MTVSAILGALRRFRQRLPGAPPQPIPVGLWQQTVQAYPFLKQSVPAQENRLAALTAGFLSIKRFHGVRGLEITDDMAVAIAAQACLPLLHLPGSPSQTLAWYDDFVTIVVHADAVVAQRERLDDAGVLHLYGEELAGEAMDGGPVMVNWLDVASSAEHASMGMNLVIHEFAHKLDMRDGVADGCPPLPSPFLGIHRTADAKRHWLLSLQAAFDAFRERVIKAERFGGEPTWLDPYAATGQDEFFAVACEAYFVSRDRFELEFPGTAELFDGFFISNHPAQIQTTQIERKEY